MSLPPCLGVPERGFLFAGHFLGGNACCFFAHVLLWPNNDRFHLTLAAKAKTPPLSQLASLPLNPNTRHPTRQGIFFLFLFSERLMLLLLRMEKSFSFVQGRSSGVPRLLTLEVKGVKRAACECVGGWMGGCHCSPPVITRRKSVLHCRRSLFHGYHGHGRYLRQWKSCDDLSFGSMDRAVYFYATPRLVRLLGNSVDRNRLRRPGELEWLREAK